MATTEFTFAVYFIVGLAYGMSQLVDAKFMKGVIERYKSPCWKLGVVVVFFYLVAVTWPAWLFWKAVILKERN